MKVMRRKDRQITDRKVLDDILDKGDVLHLAMADGNVPYVVPISFAYDGKNIYIHCAKEGLKLDFIRKNPQVCFDCVGYVQYQPTMTSCDAGTKFMSVIGRGTAETVEDFEAKKQALDLLVSHYTTSKLEFSAASINETVIVKITVTELTGKKRGM